MKKTVRWLTAALLAGHLLPAWADDAQELKALLGQVKQFSAHFQQQVFDVEGQPLQQASGELLVSRPDRFRWETKQPDESLILSDGKSVWLYDPFVEQVSITTLADAVVNTPFLLISSTDPTLWARYDVLKEEHAFTVTSKQKGQRIESLRLIFAPGGQLSRFEVNETQGQRSEFELSQYNGQPAVKADTFHFAVPKGVTVDDQR
ncbi:MAG: outer membrane lipoprotein chaperone LolA [Aeromonadaceae bacterium]|nr:outer membrane lipoprotein chaperone LolA [Aeromonadaceae bacterium]